MTNQTFTITLPAAVLTAIEDQAARHDTTPGKHIIQMLIQQLEYEDAKPPALPRVDHAATAQAWADEAAKAAAKPGGAPAQDLMYLLAYGQLQATLALVEQQRIATLVTLASSDLGAGLAKAAVAALAEWDEEENPSIRPEIRSALRL